MKTEKEPKKKGITILSAEPVTDKTVEKMFDKEFNLSDKRFSERIGGQKNYFYWEEWVKEFIKELKEELKEELCNPQFFSPTEYKIIIGFINQLAGEKLI